MARLHSTRGVKKWCPLSPFLSSHYINDADSIAEDHDVRGAVTGMDACITHMLYGDDLTLLSNEAGALQTMLCRLDVYAGKKHLLSTLLIQRSRTSTLAGMISLTLDMAKSAGNASCTMLTSAYRICCFKNFLDVKRSITNRAVLRECGHQPLQYYWSRAAVKLYNSMLARILYGLYRAVQADLKLQSKDDKCWTAQFIQAFQGCVVLMGSPLSPGIL
eukprot:1142055-Pelagomonas_calceolata.AAC.1